MTRISSLQDGVSVPVSRSSSVEPTALLRWGKQTDNWTATNAIHVTVGSRAVLEPRAYNSCSRVIMQKRNVKQVVVCGSSSLAGDDKRTNVGDELTVA